MIAKRILKNLDSALPRAAHSFSTVSNMPPLKEYGMLVSIPFCSLACPDCLYYGAPLHPSRMKSYLRALCEEIETAALPAPPSWMHIGCVNPTMGTLSGLAYVMEAALRKGRPSVVSIETKAPFVTEPALRELKALGANAITVDIGRAVAPDAASPLAALVHSAHALNMFTNVDCIAGAPNETEETYLSAVNDVVQSAPRQITLRPYFVLQGRGNGERAKKRERALLIEKAGELLIANGYDRKGLWSFSRAGTAYQPFIERALSDYVEFGAGAYSRMGGAQIPAPSAYGRLARRNRGKHTRVFPPDSSQFFASMIMRRTCAVQKNYGLRLKMGIGLLRAFGYCEKGALTSKGTLFAHEAAMRLYEGRLFPLANSERAKNEYDDPRLTDAKRLYADENVRAGESIYAKELIAR